MAKLLQKRTSPQTARPLRVARPAAETLRRQLLWIYPPLLGAAEALVGAGLPLAGMILHGLLLLALANHSAFGAPAGARRLALALLLVPLMRFVALALPTDSLPAMALFSASGAALLIAAWLVVRALRLPRAAVGLTLGGLWMQLMLMGCGIGLGYAAYVLLEPAPLAGGSWQLIAATALALLLFAGFAEELVFRGLLQTVAGPVLGRWGPLYVAVLYGAIQAGFGSPLYALLAFIVGLAFAGVVRLSGSIVGVALAHGASSIVLLIVMPYVTANPGSPLALAFQPAMVMGGVCAALAVLLLAQARLVLRPRGATPAPSGNLLGQRRREARLTYVALGQLAGLPARLIAELELGLQPIAPEHATRIAAALGIGAHDLIHR